MSSAADSSVKLVASPQVSYALILALIGSYGGGAWFLATQTATQAAMNERIATNKKETETSVAANRLEAEKAVVTAIAAVSQRMLDGDAAINERMTRFVNAWTERMNNLDRSNEQRSAAVSALDARMARIESKLDFLMQNLKPGR